MQKPHQKILFLAEVMNFLNLDHNTITIRLQTSNRDISKQLGSYVHHISFYKLISGIFEKKMFDLNGRKWALRCTKIIFLQIPQKIKDLELNVVNIQIPVILSYVQAFYALQKPRYD